MVVVYLVQLHVQLVETSLKMNKIKKIIIRIMDVIEDYLYSQYPNLTKHMKKK